MKPLTPLPIPPGPSRPSAARTPDVGSKSAPPNRDPAPKPNRRTKGVLFIPHTPGGELARKIQGEEDKFSDLHQVARVKVVERGGTQLADILGRKDPWARSHCGKGDCLICCAKAKKEWTPSTCRQESVVYAITCDRCKDAQVDAKYYEETSQMGYLHGRELSHGQANKLEDNPLWKHDEVHHLWVQGSYSMCILRKHSKPLSRQMHEATEIECSKAHVLLNSKGEYNGSQLRLGPGS